MAKDLSGGMSAVVDASTVLAILFNERGADIAVTVSKGAMLSAVNLVEVIEKFVARGGTPAEVTAHLLRLEITTVPFDAAQASLAADLKPVVKGLDISLADRVCMALALHRHLPIWTADSDWAQLNLGIPIRFIR